jgi:23S rRNA pseudouridine1911/1915/1917 synthase
MPFEPHLVTTDRGDAGRRLDLVLCRHLSGIRTATRTAVQNWIETGRVHVNTLPVRRVARRVAMGDVVSVDLPERASPLEMRPEDRPLDILFEDEHFLALDKPPGSVVHPTYRHSAHTVMNALLWHARHWPVSTRPSIVGRLDKLTSGIVIVAKSGRVHAELQHALTSTGAEKDYLAVVYGRDTGTRGRIDLRLRKSPLDRRRVVASRSEGRACFTEFERLASVAAPRVGLSLLRCRLLTGRTHQIRVHLASSGWPLVGDPAYGEPRWSGIDDTAMALALGAFPRQALHAWRVAFVHPVTGAQQVLHAPVPRDIGALLAATGLRWAEGESR